MATPTGPRQGRKRSTQATQTSTSPAIPTGPSRAALPAHACRALHENGAGCQVNVQNEEHLYCPKHHKEYKRLYKDYKTIEKQYNAIENGPDKIAAGRKDIDLRGTVNLRFFSYPGADNRTHSQHILSVKTKVHQMVEDMERKVAVDVEEQKEKKRAQDAAEEEKKKKKEQDKDVRRMHSEVMEEHMRICGGPRTRMSAITAPIWGDGIPHSTGHRVTTTTPERGNTASSSSQTNQLSLPPTTDPTTTLRAQPLSLASRRERLYQSWPGLMDADTMRLPSDKDLITRLLFRKLVALHASETTWIRAKTTYRIDRFLQESSEDEFVSYERTLGEIANRTCYTFHLLRNAVCEFCADSPDITAERCFLLGGTVLASDRRDRLLQGRIMDAGKRKMTARGWELLYTHFRDMVTWRDLPWLSTCYDDFVAAKTLTVFEAFGEKGDNSNNQSSTWYCPFDDLAVHNRVHRLLLNGFVTVATNSFGQDVAIASRGQEIRQYIVGRMAKSIESLLFMAALRERAADLVSFCLDHNDLQQDGFLDSLYSKVPMDDLWVTRRRLILNPTFQPWTEEETFIGVLREINTAPTMNNPPSIAVPHDYYELVIMNRSAHPTQHIVDMVDNVFSALDGRKLTMEDLKQNAVAKYVPAKDTLLYHERIRRLLGPLAPLTDSRTWAVPGLTPEPESTMRSPLLPKPRGTALRGTERRPKTKSYMSMIWDCLFC